MKCYFKFCVIAEYHFERSKLVKERRCLLNTILQIGAMLPAARPRGYCTVVWRGSQKRYRCLPQQPVEAGRGTFPNPHMPGITGIPVFLPIIREYGVVGYSILSAIMPSRDRCVCVCGALERERARSRS